MAANNEPTWRGAAGAKPRAAKKVGWKQEDPQAATGSAKRRAKLLALAVGGAGAVVGIVWLILLLMAHKRPGLLVIAADPAYEASKGVGRLDVPYDPYGWLSGVRLLDWARQVGSDENTPKALGETPYWLDEIDDWADQVGRDSTVDPVVIYVGLHGGVNRAGDPILYVGRDLDRRGGGLAVEDDRPAVRLAAVLDKLDDRAAKKRKLLVLDTGRALPDPNLGEVASDFAWAVKKQLGDRIAQNPTLAVVLAADEGQRAWDSADLGMTALSYHLMKSLAAGAGRENMASFRADELFVALRREVEQWSKNNRPTAQTPVLLPDENRWAADETRKARFAERLFYKPTGGGPPLEQVSPPAPLSPPAELVAEWQTAARLADRVPPPAAYTPAAWRRYRELLLRLEQATMAGDVKGAVALRVPLDAACRDIERGLDVKPEAVAYQLPLAAGLGQAPPPIATAAYDVPTANSLAAAADRAKATLRGETRVPVELHLPLMLQHYAKTVLQVEADPGLEARWKVAVATRLLAEQAALGVPTGSDGRGYAAGLPYSERVWPDVAKAVQEADAARRRGEDRMLGPAAATADPFFTEAATKYHAALEDARQRQEPLRLRDRVLADLPFLTRWLTETDDKTVAGPTEAVHGLWQDSFLLADKLDQPFDPPAVAAAAANVTKRHDELLGHVARLAKALLTADTQTNWQSIEHLLLLPPPLVSPADRKRLVERARDISRKFNEAAAEVAGNPRRPEEKIVRRVKAAADSLGGGWVGWAARQRDLAPVTGNLNATDPQLHEKAAGIAADVAAHRDRQADFKKYPTGGRADWAQAEQFSRVAAPLAALAGFEPAAVNAQHGWKTLLEAQAARIALDHWYNEKGQPYFSTTVAQTFLTDAGRVADLLPEARREKSPDAVKAARLALVPPLRLQNQDATDGPVRWTTEADRTFRYRLMPTPYRSPDDDGKVPAYDVPGEAVLRWEVTQPGLLTLAAPGRQLADLSRPADADRAVVLTAGPQIEDAAKDPRATEVVAGGYFRGQRHELQQKTAVRVNRRPDLVVTDVRPTRPGVLAVRADKEFDPGAVSILLDFSASMSDKRPDSDVSKKDEVMAVLEDLLRDLPGTTELTVRVFHDNPGFADKNSTLVYPGSFGTQNFRTVLGGANGIIDRIRNIPVKGATPLVPTLKEAIADIKTDYQGVKTVIVLTDGADTTRQPDVFAPDELKGRVVEAKDMKPAQRQGLIDKVRADVQAVKRDDVSVHMVIFGAGPEEEELGEEMFKKVEEWETPGRVYRATDKTALKRELEDALRPKPRLLMKNGTAVAPDADRRVYIPRSGLPTNRSDQTEGELRWWGFIRPDLYDLKYFRFKQGLKFDPGDALCVRLEKGDRGQVRFRRELYYRHVVDMTRQPGRADDTDADWYLSAPEFAWRNSNFNYLTTTVALEEKRGTEVDPTGDLQPVRPRFVWWDLTRAGPAGDERFPGPVSVHNLDGHHAPSWRLVGDNGSAPLDAGYKVRGWVHSSPPLLTRQSVRVGGGELKAGTSQTVTAETVLRAKIETVPFVGDPSVNKRLPADATGSQQCLVVRVDDTRGRLLQVLVPQLNVAVKEHRYFYDKEARPELPPRVAGYTAVFGPLSEDAVARLAELEFQLVSVTDAIAAVKKPLLLELKNPSKTARDLNPVDPLAEPRKDR